MDCEEDNLSFASLLPDDLHICPTCPSTSQPFCTKISSDGRKLQCRKRDDIRSSGSARPGETSSAARPYRHSAAAASLLLQYCLLLLFFGPLRWQGVTAIQLPDVYWNSSNPIFRIDNTDHIIDVNKSPAEYDRVNIFCPRIARTPGYSTPAGTTDAQSQSTDQNGHYIIYNVSKEEYETCRVTNPTARRMLVCDNPSSDRLSYVTITFRPFSPQPNGPEFHAGHDYYFITTSTGTEAGLDNKFGGRCLSHNMKLLFKVAGQESSENADDVETKVSTSQAQSTTFKLSQQERLPVYETVVDERPLPQLLTTTIPFFFRPRTTPYRPRIMKYSPKPPVQPSIDVNVIDTDDNHLPTTDVRSTGTHGSAQSVDVRRRPRTTTPDYFNLIREEDAAVPARQTKSRPAAKSSAAAGHCPEWMFVMLLLVSAAAVAMPGMLQRV